MSQSDSSLHYEIHHNNTLDQDYFTFPTLLASTSGPDTSGANIYCLYINYNKDVPPNTFVWDYFSSGELYINLPDGKSIESAKESFRNLYRNYFMKPDRLGNPLPVGTSPFDFVTSVISPTSYDTQAWLFHIPKFFNLKDSNSTPTSTPAYPICSFFTLNDSSKPIFIKSDSYSFANIPENTSFCSCPSLASQSPYTSCAPYILSNAFTIPTTSMNNCSGYNPETTLLQSKCITLDNTNTSMVVILEYFLSCSFMHQFNISSVSENKEVTLISSLSYPLTEDYDELLKSATEIYNTFLANYVNVTTSDSIEILQEDTLPVQSEEVNSYISSLLTI